MEEDPGVYFQAWSWEESETVRSIYEGRSFSTRVHERIIPRIAHQLVERGHISEIVRSWRLSRVDIKRERKRGNAKWILLISSPLFDILLLFATR